jgi:hypothetical protein
MKASEAAKLAGFKTLAEVSELTGVSTQTLNNWHNNKPLRFRSILKGAMIMKLEKI